jgi:hypothetical protein
MGTIIDKGWRGGQVDVHFRAAMTCTRVDMCAGIICTGVRN